MAHLDFDSAYDIGCANGFLLSEFQRRKRTVHGIDLSPDLAEVVPPDLRPHVRTADFSASSGSWDLVCCVELAEHVPAERSTELVDTLVRVARRWICFSAAPPGQRGTGHINLRPHSDWLGWFAERNWTVDEPRTDALRRDMRSLQHAPWLRRNCYILRNGAVGAKPIAGATDGTSNGRLPLPSIGSYDESVHGFSDVPTSDPKTDLPRIP